MATLTVDGTASKERRSAWPLHRNQKGYACWFGVMLFLYSSLFFTLAFLGPYVMPAVTLMTDTPLYAREVAAEKFLLLHETVWVAVPVLFFGAVIFSLVMTSRLAGPLYRLEEGANEWAKRNLSWRIQFRQTDRLDALATSANDAFANIEKAFHTIHDQNGRVEAVLTTLLQDLNSQPALSRQTIKNAEEALAATGNIRSVVTQFHIGQSR